jgi:hypothetical protein
MKTTTMRGAFVLLVGWAVLCGISVAQESSPDASPNHSTACAIAIAPPARQGTILVSGAANLGCGGRSEAEIDADVLSQCPQCTVVAHFTHACGAYAATAGNNKSNTASGWAIAQFGPDEQSFGAQQEAQRQSVEKCTSNGGVQCYVRLTKCDTGTYKKAPGSGRSAR